MSDEETAFVAAITAAPRCLTTRGAFADWLEEHDRDRAEAEGWAALAILNLEPYDASRAYEWWLSPNAPETDRSELPEDWFNALEGGIKWPPKTEEHYSWDYDSLPDATVAAVVAFAKLPPERRAELLSGVPQ